MINKGIKQGNLILLSFSFSSWYLCEHADGHSYPSTYVILQLQRIIIVVQAIKQLYHCTFVSLTALTIFGGRDLCIFVELKRFCCYNDKSSHLITIHFLFSHPIHYFSPRECLLFSTHVSMDLPVSYNGQKRYYTSVITCHFCHDNPWKLKSFFLFLICDDILSIVSK